MIDEKQAIDLRQGNYGKESLDQLAGYAAALFWQYRDEDGALRQTNGSMFFVDAGEGIFAVTAKHVFDRFVKQLTDSTIVDFGIVAGACGRPGRAAIAVPLDERRIAADGETDVATFSLTDDEMRAIGARVITTWPPAAPRANFAIGLTGYPGRERTAERRKEAGFAAYPVLAVAASVSDRQVTVQFTGEDRANVLGFDSAPANCPAGGMSGGPLLTPVARDGGHDWRLGGVIISGFPAWGLLKASRVDRLNADGTFRR